ncbi:MAG: hypothetical protein JWQ75_2087, partial [Pseudarthrobacter sp.]|nr:hypothetical protein [Pseudarthrobacter sp.]
MTKSRPWALRAAGLAASAGLAL